jgi:hypothetical protein
MKVYVWLTTSTTSFKTQNEKERPVENVKSFERKNT